MLSQLNLSDFIQTKNHVRVCVIIGVLVVGGLAFYSTDAGLFQGRLTKNLKLLPTYDENKCTDIDGGKNYEEAGTVYGKVGRSKFGNKTDYCSTRTQLTEYYCDGKFIKEEKYLCGGGCGQGGCKKEYQKLDNVIDTLVIVDSDDYDIDSSDIEDLFGIANTLWLQPKTGFKFGVMDLKIISFTEEGITSFHQYLDKKYFKDPESKISLPEYIVAFDKDGVSEIYGGYSVAYQFFWLIDNEEGYCTEFPAITTINKISVPGAIIDYGHKFGICGYDILQKNIASEVSGNGECKGQNGIACVVKNGYQMCPDFVDEFYAKHPLYFTADTLVHELLHSYSENGSLDHFGTYVCNEAMGEKMKELEDNGISPPFDTLDQEYAVMCPNAWENFKNTQKFCD